jgi:hypothetical protein
MHYEEKVVGRLGWRTGQGIIIPVVTYCTSIVTVYDDTGTYGYTGSGSRTGNTGIITIDAFFKEV